MDVLAIVRAGTTGESFAAVFNAHHRRAVRLAFLLTSDVHQAEDIAAEAFAKVYVRWSRGEIHDVGAYVRRAVVNEANSKLRRRYVERREASRRSADDRGERTIEDTAVDRDQVWDAIQRLPSRQRQAVVLRYYEDLPEQETAELLGCSVGTVKSQVSRALGRLELLLGTGDRAGHGGEVA